MNLQLTWFILIAVLVAGYAVLDGFDLGIGVLYPFIARNKGEHAVVRSAIGPVWDGNEVWLVTAAGALFAAFPPVYAMVFSGFYLPIMLILFGLIFRAVALGFHHRDDRGSWIWDGAFWVGSLVPAVLFGITVGNIVRGVPLSPAGDFTGSVVGLFNPFALLVGVTSLVMFLQHGAAWAALRCEGALHLKATKTRSAVNIVFLALVAALTLLTALTQHDRFHNVIVRPLGWVMIALLLAGLVGSRFGVVRKRDVVAFLGSAMSIAALVGLAAVGNYPALVPARGTAPDTTLAVSNAASGVLTLKAMSVVAAIGLPLVLAYTVWIYRTFAGKVPAGMTDY